MKQINQDLVAASHNINPGLMIPRSAAYNRASGFIGSKNSILFLCFKYFAKYYGIYTHLFDLLHFFVGVATC